MMRIVAGTYRHRKIDYPKNQVTRPTMDKVREALMSSIGININGRVVLDLFAGSGAMGIESLSRGAKVCYFVDNDKEAIKTIKSNLKSLSVKEETHVELCSYQNFLERNKDKKFSLVFLDPPYAKKEIYEEVMLFLKENDMLTSDAIVVKEADIEMKEDDYFSSYRHYRYGMIHVNIYWR